MRWPFLLAALLAIALVLPLARADDNGWEDEGRDVHATSSSDGFEMRSENVGTYRDEMRLQLEGSNAEFRFDLYASAGATSAEAELRAGIEHVVEFADNGDSRLGPGDTILATYDPGNLEFRGVSAENVTSPGGVPGVQVTATYGFHDSEGTLRFRATAFGNVTTFQGATQSPVEVKLDLLLNGFPYTSGSGLPAVELRVQAEATNGPALPTDGVSFTAGNVTAKFGWKTTAVVDGTPAPVGVTVTRLPNDGSEATVSVAFAYPHGDAIEHDPTFGYARTLPTSGGGLPPLLGDWTFYAVGGVAALAVFVPLALVRGGRKVKGK